MQTNRWVHRLLSRLDENQLLCLLVKLDLALVVSLAAVLEVHESDCVPLPVHAYVTETLSKGI